MISKTELAAILAYVEEASEGRSALEEELARALGWTQRTVGGVIPWFSPDNPDRMEAAPPRWSRDLNAAIKFFGDQLPGWSYHLSGPLAPAAQLEPPISKPPYEGVVARGGDLALAILGATLRGMIAADGGAS